MEVDNAELERIDRFWDWFRDNAPNMMEIKAGNHASFESLEEELSRVHKGLMFEVCGSFDSPVLVISADGIRAHIPHVLAVVRRAPADQAWKIISFRQRTVDAFILNFNELSIDSTILWFELSIREEMIDIRVHFPSGTDIESRSAVHCAFIVLDQLLGEYDVMTKMGRFDLMHVPAYPEQCGLIPAKRLAEEFDKLWEQLCKTVN